MNRNLEKKECKFCNKLMTVQTHGRHQDKCFQNPDRIVRRCPVCNEPMHCHKSTTCSRKCRHILFGAPNKNGINGIDYEDSYRKVCFTHHPHYCVICHENLVLAVHHFDEDKNNNEPENLIPLCLTHHVYMHSKYKELIIEQVEFFILKCFRFMWE